MLCLSANSSVPFLPGHSTIQLLTGISYNLSWAIFSTSRVASGHLHKQILRWSKPFLVTLQEMSDQLDAEEKATCLTSVGMPTRAPKPYMGLFIFLIQD